MARLNQYIAIGRLTRDPEIRTLNGGATVSKLGLAVNNSRKDKNTGQWIDEPMFLDCEHWDSDKLKRSEYISQNMRKGSDVLINGELRMETWADKASGTNRSKITCRLNNIQLVGKVERAEQAQQSQHAPPAEPQRQEYAPVDDDRIPF